MARKEYSAQDGAGRESEGDSGAMHNHLGSREPQGDSDPPANYADDYRFYEELDKDMSTLGAHCHPNADFPGPLCDRDQQDVHDADSGHQK